MPNIVKLQPGTTNLIQRLDAAQSSTRWLESWSPAEPLLPEQAAAVPVALEAVQAAMQPASAKAFAIAADRLVDWIETFGVIPLPDDRAARDRKISTIVQGYRAALADLPEDLLARAIDRLIAEHRFSKLPLPGEVRKLVAEDLSERNVLLRRLETAQLMASKRPAIAHQPGDMTEAGRKLVADAFKRMPSHD